MIVIDTSSLIAIFLQEPDSARFEEAIVEADSRLIPSHVYLEFVMVTARRAVAREWLDGFISKLAIVTSDIDQLVSGIAADAFMKYGKGRAHRARLNFGDCLSYAVAKRLGAPLLYKGEDFLLTDIESALPA